MSAHPQYIQPPTPIMCHSSFTDFYSGNSQQQHQHGYTNTSTNNYFPNSTDSTSPTNYSRGIPIKRTTSTESSHSAQASSYDLSAADDTSSSNGSNSQYSHDPYVAKKQRKQLPYSANSGEAELQQYPSNASTIPYYATSQQIDVACSDNLPPSLRQATMNRQRDLQQQQQYYLQDKEERGPSTGPASFEYPVYQQSSQQIAEYRHSAHEQQHQKKVHSSFDSHSSPSNSNYNSRQTSQRFEVRSEESEEAAKPFPECCYHKALVNKMEFIQPPAVTSAGAFAPGTRSNNYLRVFVGQCRFESTAAEVRWMIHYLTSIEPVKVELRGTGCFMAYVQSHDEVQAFLQLKDRLLFDHAGVWFARDEEQASFLRQYVKSYVSSIGKGFRLPKDMVVLHDQQLVQQQRSQQRNGSGAQTVPQHHYTSNSRHQQGANRGRNPNNNFYTS